jgi:cytoskeletal protein CcmA (bactofilin family)
MPMKPPWIPIAAASLATLAFAQPMHRGMSTAERDLGSDHFAAGCPLRIAQPVAGDLLAVGCDTDVSGVVGGDVALAGGSVRVDASVGNGVYAAGGKVTLNGSVGRNVRAAGGHLEIGPNAKVSGNVTVAGGDVAVRGAVKGYLQAAGGHVLIDGPVDGDVAAAGGEVELGPNARIGGKLRYRSENFKRDPAAQVVGAVEVLEGRHTSRMDGDRWHHRALGGWIWSLGLMLMTAVIAGAMPAASERLAQRLRAHPGLALLWGLIAFACIPVAAILLTITIIGIPLAILTILLYAALLLTGYAVAAAALADLALRRYKPEATALVAWRVGAAILAMLALTLLARVPFLGGLVVLAAMLAGIGAVAASVFGLPANQRHSIS